MAVKINTLKEEEIRAIGDAFADFEYENAEWGMSYLGKDRQAVSDYICAYVRTSIKNRMLYSTSERHEAFIAFKKSGEKTNPGASAELLRTIPGFLDLGHACKMAKGIFHAGKSYGGILAKLKIPHVYVGMVAVTKEYQGQGYLRKLLEIAFEEGRKHALPVVLDTDAILKRDKYEHVGMKCVTTQRFADGVELYSLVYEPESLPKEWKSETVLADAKILKEQDKNIWDRFAPIYSHFVTGTPGNKKAYESMYQRIRKVVKDKEVLEIATGPGVIAKQVADEAKSMIATDFSDKMLAVARRGMVPENLKFEWANAQYLPYADESFDVVIIANALHVIPDPEKVLKEILRVLRPDGILIAPNFVHDNQKKVSEAFSKMLSMAGVEFKAKWSMEGYLAFLKENGFHVTGARQFPSTIPLAYAECKKK